MSGKAVTNNQIGLIDPDEERERAIGKGSISEQEEINYLSNILTECQTKVYEKALDEKRSNKSLRLDKFFTEDQKSVSVRDPSSFLHKLLIVSLEDFDSAKWSPTTYSQFIFKALMVIMVASLESQLEESDVDTTFRNIPLPKTKGGKGESSKTEELSAKKFFLRTDASLKKLMKSSDTQARTLSDIKEELEKIKEKLKVLPDEIGNSVIGQPYTRFDSTTTHLPCLIFHFVEPTPDSKKRIGQIKVRVKLEDIINDDQGLKNQFATYRSKILERVDSLGYRHGTNRLNLVSKDKSWKTVLFVDSEADGIEILKNIAFICDHSISESDISFTTLNNRNNVYTRENSLDGMGTNKINYKENFVLKLKKVVCYIKNLDRLVIIWKGDN